MKERKHIPVLLKEAVQGLNIKSGMTVIDATLGGGGHSREILSKIGATGKLIVIDKDQSAIKDFSRWCEKNHKKNVVLVNRSFSDIEDILKTLNIDGVDGILTDLGWSSDQVGDSSRGFSFLFDGPLDMRLDQRQNLTAEYIVNNWNEAEIEKIFYQYGEEKWAKKIASTILKERAKKRIESTLRLSEIVASSIPKKFWPQRIHPATKVFQALRIAVNDELGELEKFLPSAIEKLKVGGRISIITFHSLEDRIVKNIFRENARGCICPKEFPVCRCHHYATLKDVTRHPIVAEDEELELNPRSRSAKLRIAERVKDHN